MAALARTPAFDGGRVRAGQPGLTARAGVGPAGPGLADRSAGVDPDVRADPDFPRAAAADRRPGWRPRSASRWSAPTGSRDASSSSPTGPGPVRSRTGHHREPGPAGGRGAAPAPAGRRIRRSEARLRAVLDAALDCVVITDADGVVLEFNPAACTTFGLRRDEAVGREHDRADRARPTCARGTAPGWRGMCATGQPHILDRRLEITGHTLRRHGLPGRAHDHPDRRRRTARLRRLSADLSDRHRAEEELRAARHRVSRRSCRSGSGWNGTCMTAPSNAWSSVGTTLARARTALPDEPDRAAAILDDAIVGLEEAAIELRDLARGIHPASLTRYGLAAALRDVARRSPIDLELGIDAGGAATPWRWRRRRTS